MVYKELTNISGAVLPDFFTYANDVTGGVAGMIILSTTFFVIFLSLGLTGDKTRALAMAGFITSLLSVPFYFASIVPQYIMWGSFITTFLLFVVMKLFEEDI